MKVVALKQPGLEVQLEREGAGRFVAYLCRKEKGRMRIGMVLGGFRTWTAEPAGKAPPRRGTSAVAVARDLAAWALTQPGGKALVAA